MLAFTMNRGGAFWSWISNLCLKLSNSGDTLKLMIPNYIRKDISGQNNYLGMVTSHKMSENEMGYRGSKSDNFSSNKSVKEQRVDGSWFIKKIKINKFKVYSNGFREILSSQNPF